MHKLPKDEKKGETRTHKSRPMQKENLMLIKKLMRDVEPLLVANKEMQHLRANVYRYIGEKVFGRKSRSRRRSCEESFKVESADCDGAGEQDEFLQDEPEQVMSYQEILYQEAVQLQDGDDICNNLDLSAVTLEDDDNNYPGGEVLNMDHASTSSSYDVSFGTDSAEFADDICLLRLNSDKPSALKTEVIHSCMISDASGSWKWSDGVCSVRLRLNNPPDTGIGLKCLL
jgi:hypothetical protein